MPIRDQVLARGEIYHVFNHAVGNENIFTLRWYLNRALELIDYYRFPQTIRFSKFKALSIKERNDYLSKRLNVRPLVEIYSFALMPNHHHLLLKQLENKGISTFISNFQNGFAKYFNLKNNRRGTLFGNPFKAKWIETDEEFVHVSRYIHLNPVTSFLIEFPQLINYPWTSLSYYVKDDKKAFIKTSVLIEMFKTKEKYFHFVADQVDYQRKLGLIKRLMME